MPKETISRRKFLTRAVAAAASISIVPRYVLGGPGVTAPSDTVGTALIGCGGRGAAGLHHVGAYRMLARCDVDLRRLGGEPDNKTRFKDFRRLLERKDIDVVCIATPPHWHALVSIAAAEMGKDIFCEKPMTKFIREGRAVVAAVKRYGRVFQIGTFGRFGANRRVRKLMASGVLGPKVDVQVVKKGGFKVRQWSGRTDLVPQPVPEQLDYDFWLGPVPYKPYHKDRVHGKFRCYWDYDGGGLADMAQHHLDPIQYMLNKDDTSPVEIEAHAPWPPHPDACGMWGWVKMRYEDGTTLILESGEWGESTGERTKLPSESDLTDEQKQRLAEFPDPQPLVDFGTAVRTRQQAGGNAEAAHRCATLLHLANIAIRTGRKLRYDPVAERFIGDEEANRFVDIPMRAPWHL